jgi:predicted DNA-binding ribbon-helix-helix protein
MVSSIVKRSVYVSHHKTSVSLEDEFWESLRKIARGRGENLPQVIAAINADRGLANLSSAIRLFVLRHYRNQRDRQDRIGIPLAPINGNSIEV